MAIFDSAFDNTEGELTQLFSYLSSMYGSYHSLRNWSLSRMLDWKYGVSARSLGTDPEFFSKNLHFWRDGGAIIGFAVSEQGKDMTVQTGPDRRLLDETIIEWIENVWGMDKDKIVIPSFADDAWRQNILKKRGYRLAGSRGFLRKYDVNLSPHQAPLEDKFVLSDLGRSKDTDGVIGVVSKACGSDLIDREWFMSRQNAPGFQPGTVVQAMSSKGICVSCAGARIDWKQNYAEIELIATHPDFQKKGLAKACLAECFKRLSDMKVRYAYIGPTNMSSHSYRLFESMLPIEKVEEFSWELAR